MPLGGTQHPAVQGSLTTASCPCPLRWCPHAACLLRWQGRAHPAHACLTMRGLHPYWCFNTPSFVERLTASSLLNSRWQTQAAPRRRSRPGPRFFHGIERSMTTSRVPDSMPLGGTQHPADHSSLPTHSCSCSFLWRPHAACLLPWQGLLVPMHAHACLATQRCGARFTTGASMSAPSWIERRRPGCQNPDCRRRQGPRSRRRSRGMGVSQELGCHFPGDEGVRASVSVLQQRVVRERTPGPSCPQIPAGGLSTWSDWSCGP